MFEQANRKNGFFESVGALGYLVKSNPVSAIFYCGAIPFAVLWIAHNSVATAFALQAYCVTTLVLLDDPFRTERQNVKEWWFWKALLRGGALIHPFVLAGIWWLDAAHLALVTRGVGLFSVAFVAGALEVVVLGLIVDRCRPPDRAKTGPA
jgi:hypothetical protein